MCLSNQEYTHFDLDLNRRPLTDMSLYFDPGVTLALEVVGEHGGAGSACSLGPAAEALCVVWLM